MTSLNPLAQEQIAKLHRECIDSRNKVSTLLRLAATGGATFFAGVSRRAAAREGKIQSVGERTFSLVCRDFSPVSGRHYYFSFQVEHDEFFFVSQLKSVRQGFLEFEIPRSLYRAERRESQRGLPERYGMQPLASLLTPGRPTALVRDASRDGLGLGVPGEVMAGLPGGFEVEVASVSGDRRRLFAQVRNRRQESRYSAWIGLSVSSVPSESPVEIEHARRYFEDRAGWRQIALASQIAGVGVDRVRRSLGSGIRATEPSVVRFRNQLDQYLVGLVNSTGTQRGAPVVLIPPAWGKTKETLLPLALTIVETCRSKGLAVSVLRFDGSNRRGESFVEPECRVPGEEYRRFRFSQAVQDLKCALRFVRESEEFKAPSCLIVSFSLSAIEARRVVADASPGEVSGWIPVVGMVDLQSGLRAVSGGVDYAEGILKGVEFGRHELVGVMADMDFTGRDAIEAGLVFREDARRDMAKIDVPVTWIHGEYDAWIDASRAREVLRAGSARNRRFIQVPTGHQLRTSREAFATFELIASEAVRMLWGRTVSGKRPALKRVDRIREIEAKRRKVTCEVDLRAFWRDYLLGREGRLGMDLLTATSTYREMMQIQINALMLEASSRVVDLGSGTGSFLRELAKAKGVPPFVVASDFVMDALKRIRLTIGRDLPMSIVQLDLDGTSSLPLADESVDAVLASLVVSYLRAPEGVLREVRRVLRPGGRAVISSLRRDADISSIYSDGVAELVALGADGKISAGDVSFAEIQRSFLNEAAKLVDLEEQGLFRFYDEDELRSLASDGGLRVISAERALGVPPQAIVLVAERPS